MGVTSFLSFSAQEFWSLGIWERQNLGVSELLPEFRCRVWEFQSLGVSELGSLEFGSLRACAFQSLGVSELASFRVSEGGRWPSLPLQVSVPEPLALFAVRDFCHSATVGCCCRAAEREIAIYTNSRSTAPGGY